MKKLFKKIILPVIALGCFTACEDVPAPYFIQEQEENDPSKTGIFLSETFASSLGKFKVVTEEAEGYSWANSYSTAYISGYQNSVNKATKTWLVSPSFDLTGQDAVQAVFDYVLRYKRTTTKELLRVSADYVGDVTTATWYDLDIKMTEGKDYTTFYSTGANLPAEVLNQPNVVVALYYEAGGKEASTWEVKNLVVKKGEYQGEGGDTPTNDTTRENPFSVSQAIANQNGNAWVKGFIVGCVEGQKLAEGAQFNGVSGVVSNILLAETAEESDVSKCLVVQLPVGDVRTAINLSDNPNNLMQEVILYGSLETYFGAPGMKNTSFAIFYGNSYGTDPDKTVDLNPKGDGTLESPYNPAAAILYAQSLGTDVNSPNDVYIKGKILEFDAKDGNYGSNNYGNATFTIVEEGAEDVKFICFRCMYFGNKKYESGDIPQVGDEVVVYGKVVNYRGNTPETVSNQACLYSINGVVGDGGGSSNLADPTGSGTLDDPYNVAMATQVASALASDAVTDYVYIKGKVSSIKENYNQSNSQYGNATYFISDDGTTNGQFYVFRSLYFNNEKYVSGDVLNVGDDVVVYGKLTNYRGTTLETVQNDSYLYSLNGQTSSGQGGGDSGTVTGGTYDAPFSVAKVLETYVDGKQIPSYVKGYIVGYINGNGFNENTVKFELPEESQTEILLADSPNETDFTKCIPVQLPRGAVRDGLDLYGNQGLLGQQVLLYGSIEKYFSVAGLKSTSYAEVPGGMIGSKPE